MDGANSIGDYPKPQYQGIGQDAILRILGYLVPFSRLTIQKVGDTQKYMQISCLEALSKLMRGTLMTVLSNKRARTNNETYGRHKRTSLDKATATVEVNAQHNVSCSTLWYKRISATYLCKIHPARTVANKLCR